MRWTPKMLEWLEQKAPGKTFKELALLFNNRFYTEASYNQIKCICGYYGIKTGYNWNEEICLPIGTERILYKKTGIIYVKTSYKAKGHASISGTWVSKQNLLWEKKHGKMPKNHVVIFLDGNKHNFRINNLLLVSRKIFFYMSVHNMLTDNADLTKTNYAIVEHWFAIVDAIKRERGLKRYCPSKDKRYKLT